MNVHVFECSTALGFATICAIRRAISSNPSEVPVRCVLLASINSRYPEVDDWFSSNETIRDLARREFDDVLLLNDEIFPVHPSAWNYHKTWVSHRERWHSYVGGKVTEVWVESLQVAPSRTLSLIFSDARIRVYSDGLMVYSPTRFKLPNSILRRVSDVYYVDYLEGIVPLLLEEAEPEYSAFPVAILKGFFDQMIAHPESNLSTGERNVVFVGQALAYHKMMTDAEEVELYVEALVIISRDLRAGIPIFKPHPTASAATNREVARRFQRTTGADLEIVERDVPIESLLGRATVDAICGVFSTALFTVAQMYDVPAFSFRTKDVMCALSPFSNSNRIPLLAADIYLPSLYELATEMSGEPGQELSSVARRLYEKQRAKARLTFRDAQVMVGFHMQPEILSHRAAEAERLFGAATGVSRDIYLAKAPLLEPPAGEASVLQKALQVGASWVVERYLGERKRAKFLRDPHAFFEDSRNPVARSLGAMYSRVAYGESGGKR